MSENKNKSNIDRINELSKKLNKNQRNFCHMMANPEYRIQTKTDMAKELKVSRDALYKWLRREDVREYINLLIEFYTDTELGNVWKAHIREIKRGNINAIKLFYEMKQLYVPPQQVVDLQMKDAKATINIITNIPEKDDDESIAEDSENE